MEQMNLFGLNPKKLEVTVLESLEYFSNIIIEAPDDISEKALDKIISKINRDNRYSDSLDDIAKALAKEKRIKVVQVINFFPDKPINKSFNIIDVEDFEE